jgi:hypothetical protein
MSSVHIPAALTKVLSPCTSYPEVHSPSRQADSISNQVVTTSFCLLLNSLLTDYPAILYCSVYYDSLSPQSRILEKLIVPQLVKFAVFYRIRRFSLLFTKVCHCSISWARWIQSIPFLPVCVRSILMFFQLCLCLSDDLFPSGFHIKLFLHIITYKHITCVSWDSKILCCIYISL